MSLLFWDALLKLGQGLYSRKVSRVGDLGLLRQLCSSVPRVVGIRKPYVRVPGVRRRRMGSCILRVW